MTAVEQLKLEFFSYAEPNPMSIDDEKWTISLEDFEHLIKKFSELEGSKRLDDVMEAYVMGRQNKTIKEFNERFIILI